MLRSRSSRPAGRLPLTALLVPVVLGACGGAEGSAVCDDAVLESRSGAPLDSVFAAGVPASMGDSLWAEVRTGDEELTGVAPAARWEDGRVRVSVPLHPTWRREGGTVELAVTNGSATCPPRSFEIEPLPAAPGATEELLERAEGTLRAQAAVFGADLETLRTARADSLVAPLLPLAVAARTLDRLDTIPDGDGSSRVQETLDALVARSRAGVALVGLGAQAVQVKRQIERREASTARRLPPSPPSRSRIRQSAPRPVLASLGPSARPRPPSPARSAGRAIRQAAGQDVRDHVLGFDEVTCEGDWSAPIRYPPDFRDPSAWYLDKWMTLATIGAIGTMPGVVEYLDGAINALGAGGLIFSGLAQYTGEPVMSRSVGAGYVKAALALEISRMLHEAWAKLLPRRFVPGSFEIDLAPMVLAEDDSTSARWETITVSARSRGWQMDEEVAGFLLNRLPGEVDDLVGEAPSAAVEASAEFMSAIVGEMKARIADEATLEEKNVFCVPAQTFGPVNVSDSAWSVVEVVRGGAFEEVDRHTYRPVAVGETRLRAHTHPDEFGGGPVEGRELTLEVRPIEVRVEPTQKQVEPGQVERVQAEVLHAEDTGVEWTIEQGEGRIVQSPRQLASNLHEVTVRVPDPMQGAVVVKATSTADRSHLEGPVAERADWSRLQGEPVELAEACRGEVMERTAAESALPMPFMAKAGAFDPSKLQRPGRGSMEITGLVDDGGTACTHHVAAYGSGAAFPFMGGQGQGGEMSETVEELRGLAKEMMEEEGGDSAAIARGRELMGPGSSDDVETVIQVYSPNGRIWQTGTLVVPRLTEHVRLGGWQSNAATLVNIQLRGTSPQEVEAGRTYEAVAETGEVEAGIESDSPVTPTFQAFYTWWNGDVVGVPWSSPEAKRVCEKANQQLEEAGVAEYLAQGRLRDCRYQGYAFEGVTRRVTGRMKGTVTVDSISGERVYGRFDLSGTGELLEERYEFSRNRDGRVTGDRQVDERTESGPIRMSGEFRAPNHTANLGRLVGLQTVVIPSGGSRQE